MGNSQDKITAELSEVKRQLAAMDLNNKRLKRQVYKLQKRRNELQVALDAQIQRAEKFRDAYSKLVGRKPIRLARAVLIPSRTLKEKVFSRFESMVLTLKRKVLAERAIPTSNEVNAAHNKPLEKTKNYTQKHSDMDFGQIVQEIGNLYRKEGSIREAARLASSLSDRTIFDKNQKSLIDQVEGLASLMNTKPNIAPKQNQPSFMPVQGRIMYCAHSTGYYNSNGYSTRTAGLTAALKNAGADILVVARPGYPWDVRTSVEADTSKRFTKEIHGVRTVYNPGPSWAADSLELFIQEAADIFVREAMINRPDIIVAASNHVTALPALVAARRLGVPFAYEVRGLWEVTEASTRPGWLGSDRYELSVALETLVATSADRVFAITDQVAKELVERGVDHANITILPNAADIYEFAPLPSDQKLAGELRTDDEFLVGYAGSIVQYEGLDILIEAIGKLRAKGVPAKAVIVGDGAALEDLKLRAKKIGCLEHVVFTGRVPSNEVPTYLGVFDAVVCPRVSNTVTEMVSPLKPLEAMAAGKTVIGSDVTPIVTLLGTDESRGLLFRAGDVDGLAMQIERLVSDRNLGEDIGRGARDWIVQHRSWPAVAHEMSNVFDQLRDERFTQPARQLSQITVALISDEFTRSSIFGEVELVLPTPENWRELFDSNNIDVLIVESAWEANDGSWSRKIGFYEDEKCLDLQKIIDYCHENKIPTIFWNKEDPVHFNRFEKTAALFDHIFTTDSNCIGKYWAKRNSTLISVSSLPFWAKPSLHNPLTSTRTYSHTIAYGGSYYGKRFDERSKSLIKLLNATKSLGLKIYDRQFSNSDSPYRFPKALEPHVVGGLAYSEMVQAYKAHPVHVNVNSVTESPTMFSRRIFELAASGTTILSGPAEGLSTFFGDTVAVPKTGEEATLISEMWMEDETERNKDAWEAFRLVYRSHLAVHRLAYMLRTAGLFVECPGLPAYALHVDLLDQETVENICNQSHRPAYVVVEGPIDAKISTKLALHGIKPCTQSELDPQIFSADFGAWSHDNLLGEDLVVAITYSGADFVQVPLDGVSHRGLGLWERTNSGLAGPIMKRAVVVEGGGLNIRRSLAPSPARDAKQISITTVKEPHTVLIAGHDLKFADQIIDSLKNNGHNVLIDKWTGHAKHDAKKSQEMLSSASTIFCEWSLGNIKWYSENKGEGQRLTSRFHLQELFTPYLKQTNLSAVDHTIFVGEYTQKLAIKKFGYLLDKTSVVPNTIDLKGLSLEKEVDTRFTLGLVGIVPQRKRLDRALDLLETLRAKDLRYTLRVKGHRPEDYPWMVARKNEMAYYEGLYRRIIESELLNGAVFFDQQGNDMAEWYQQIGVALSTSDFESFHYTIADGAASRAIPSSLSWGGAELIYPREWLNNSVDEMAGQILRSTQDHQEFSRLGNEARDYAVNNFNNGNVVDRLTQIIMGSKI